MPEWVIAIISIVIGTLLGFGLNTWRDKQQQKAQRRQEALEIHFKQEMSGVLHEIGLRNGLTMRKEKNNELEFGLEHGPFFSLKKDSTPFLMKSKIQNIYIFSKLYYMCMIEGIKQRIQKEGKKEAPSFDIKGFTTMTVLMKLRLVIISIFVLSTLSLILIVVNFWALGATLLLLGYLLVFVLMVKLLLIKKL